MQAQITVDSKLHSLFSARFYSASAEDFRLGSRRNLTVGSTRVLSRALHQTYFAALIYQRGSLAVMGKSNSRRASKYKSKIKRQKKISHSKSRLRSGLAKFSPAIGRKRGTN